MKLIVQVPAGATEIDIGPILEPLVARIIRLERRSGFQDVTHGEGGTDYLEAHRYPVLGEKPSGYLDWAARQWSLVQRTSRLRRDTVERYLEAQEGWEHDGAPTRITSERVVQRWHFYEHRERKKKYRNPMIYIFVPSDGFGREDRTARYLKILPDIKRAIEKEEYLKKISDAEVLDRVEAFDPVLTQLARCADD